MLPLSLRSSQLIIGESRTHDSLGVSFPTRPTRFLVYVPLLIASDFKLGVRREGSDNNVDIRGPVRVK